MTEEIRYPLAPGGIFRTFQGEGTLIGTPMVFIRLAGCSVGCQECDTNYSVSSRLSLSKIESRIKAVRGNTRWAWITGGEPTDHDLSPLKDLLWSLGFRCAIATSGTRAIQQGSAWSGWDFVSVSPHDKNTWVQRSGTQLNIVPGLNGLRLDDWKEDLLEASHHFSERWVTPCAGLPESLEQCQNWINDYPGWRLGIQAHKTWGIP